MSMSQSSEFVTKKSEDWDRDIFGEEALFYPPQLILLVNFIKMMFSIGDFDLLPFYHFI